MSDNTFFTNSSWLRQVLPSSMCPILVLVCTALALIGGATDGFAQAPLFGLSASDQYGLAPRTAYNPVLDRFVVTYIGDSEPGPIFRKTIKYAFVYADGTIEHSASLPFLPLQTDPGLDDIAPAEVRCSESTGECLLVTHRTPPNGVTGVYGCFLNDHGLPAGSQFLIIPGELTGWSHITGREERWRAIQIEYNSLAEEFFVTAQIFDATPVPDQFAIYGQRISIPAQSSVGPIVLLGPSESYPPIRSHALTYAPIISSPGAATPMGRYLLVVNRLFGLLRAYALDADGSELPQDVGGPGDFHWDSVTWGQENDPDVSFGTETGEPIFEVVWGDSNHYVDLGSGCSPDDATGHAWSGIYERRLTVDYLAPSTHPERPVSEIYRHEWFLQPSLTFNAHDERFYAVWVEHGMVDGLNNQWEQGPHIRAAMGRTDDCGWANFPLSLACVGEDNYPLQPHVASAVNGMMLAVWDEPGFSEGEYDVVGALFRWESNMSPTPITPGVWPFSNYGFVQSPGAGDCDWNGVELRYSIVPEASGTLTISTCSANTNFNTLLTVSNSTTGTSLGANDDMGSDPLTGCPVNPEASAMSVAVVGGEEYLIRVVGVGPRFVGYGLGGGDLIVGLEPGGSPPNDECAAAEAIQCNTTVTADNTFAAANAADPPFSCRSGGPARGEGTLWYSFVAEDTTAKVETCSTAAPAATDSLLGVYSGICGTLVEIACGEDDCGLLSSACLDGLTVGETYYVQLAAHSTGDLGAYELALSCPCSDLPAPGDANCDGVVDELDIVPLCLAVSDPAEYGIQYPDCSIENSDVDQDGDVDAADSSAFCEQLFGITVGCNLCGPALVIVDWAGTGDVLTIQEGIDLVRPRGEVRVRAGTYRELIDLRGKPLTAHSESGNAADVVMDGDINDDGLSDGSVVLCNSREGPDTIIEHFTVTNGRATLAHVENHGGGILIIDASPSIRGCVIEGNEAEKFGGGVAILGSGSDPSFSDTIIRNNIAGSQGGGVYTSASASTFDRCRIQGNTANGASQGGGIFNIGANMRIWNSLISHNTALSTGGAIRGANASLELINCTVVENAPAAGSAIFHGGTEDSVIVTNSVIWGNGGLQLWGDTPRTVTYSIIDGGHAGAGNLSSDPQFNDPDGLDDTASTFMDNDYSLTGGSPGIDAGDNTSLPSGEATLDLARNNRRIDDPSTSDSGLGSPPIVDIGAYEFAQPCEESPDCDDDGTPDLCQIASDPDLDCDVNGVLDTCEWAVAPMEDSFDDGVLDGNWSAFLSGATGWLGFEVGGHYSVVRIDGVADDACGHIVLRWSLDTLNDFSLRTRLGWDSTGIVEATTSVHVRMLNGDQRITDVGHSDGWLTSAGMDYVIAGNGSSLPAPGTAPLAATRNYQVIRRDSTITVWRDGYFIATGESTTPVDGVELLFSYCNFPSGPSVLGSTFIDYVHVSVPTDADCDGNRRVDACEYGDCQGNDLIDICELISAPSADCNRNGLLDECETILGPDFDLSGAVGLWDAKLFVEAMGGARAAPNVLAGCEAKYLAAFDADSDGDLDLKDVASFQLAFADGM